MPPSHWFWAKLGTDTWPGRFHPLVCHALDVGHVAAGLWGQSRPPLRRRIAAALGCDDLAAGRWLSFWIAAHDIGKLTPGFQEKGKTADLRARLPAEFNWGVGDQHHTETGTKILVDALPKGVARKVAVAVGGHHGTFPTGWEGHSDVLGSAGWAAARQGLLATLARLFGVDDSAAPNPPASADQSVWMWLAGLTSVADWIGSNRDFFPPAGSPAFVANPFDVGRYFAEAGAKATVALERLGWNFPADTGPPRTFVEATGLKGSLRPLQEEVSKLAQRMTEPTLFVIEAPMGEGKTEAAWYVADCWRRQTGAGAYVALPTMATSNQMFGRVEKFLDRTPGGNLMLLHGKAALNDLFEMLQFAAETHDADGSTSGVVAERWFAANKKHGLLAPFGVGTIDQVLLSVLQTRHGFVRLFGLAGKCVILDEVHAYDAYMTTLLERLLRWLAALGCPVVLLSATLPADKRAKLLEAYSGKSVTPKQLDTSESSWGEYPRIVTVGVGEEVAAVRNFAGSGRKKIHLDWVEDADLVRNLQQEVATGGCVAVIRNTVGLAQETFERLRKAFPENGEVTVELFHARFPFGRRKEIETDVLAKYGKGSDGQPPNPKRPAKAILVATQVVEQSLDLDFDAMYSDVAPVDLVLQRAGRLHRHDRGPRGNAKLWLITPGEKDGVPDFDNSEYVYERFVLLRSLAALKEKTAGVTLPGDLEPLIDRVYGVTERPEGDADQAKSWDAMDARRDKQRRDATNVSIDAPDEDPLFAQSAELDEDDPTVNPKIQAATRDTEPTVQLVLVYHRDGEDYLDPDGLEPFDAADVPDVARIRRLLENEVTVSHKGCFSHYVGKPVPSGWRKCGMLRCHRLARLHPNGVSLEGEAPLTYLSESGLWYEKL